MIATNDSGPTKPASLDVRQDAIPEELKQQRRWICWRYEFRESNSKPWTKPPINVGTGRPVNINDQAEWLTFEQAIELHDSGFAATDGVGIILLKEDGLVGVDLDNCRNPETGQIEDWAMEIVEQLNSYTEISPSGTGLRMFCKGTLPPEGRRSGKFEIYNSGRYVTVTGHHLEGTPDSVESRQDEIENVHAGFFENVGWEPIPLSDDSDTADVTEEEEEVDINALLHAARRDPKFNRLWSGDWGDDFPSQSEADLALCSKLAFYLNHNPKQMDYAFRQSKLYREKWEQESYSTETIQKAIDYTSGSYDHDLTSEQIDQVNSVAQALPAKEQLPPKLPELTGLDQDQKNHANRRIFKLSQLKKLPPQEWLINDHIPEQSLTLIYGPPATGKSFYALDMSLCVATGKQFLEAHDVIQGNAVYIASEGYRGIRKRAEAWLSCHGSELGSAVENNFHVIPESFDLKDVNSASSIEALIKTVVLKHPQMLVIDTLSRNLNGDENSPRDMTGFIATCGQLQRMLRCTVVVIHHTGHNTSRERGHSSLSAAADAVISVKGKVTGSKGVTIECKKQKDAAEFPPYELRGHEQPRDDSLVLLPDTNSWETKFHKLSDSARSVLSHVSKNYSTGEFRNKDLTSELGLTSSTVSDALKRLVNDGFFHKEGKQGYVVNPDASGVYLLLPPV